MKKIDRNFWKRIEEAPLRVLALDYDGTLAPFQADRMAARPLPGTREIILSIMAEGSTRVAIVSGRPINELYYLLGGFSKRVVMIGSHGWEIKGPGLETRRGGPGGRIEEVLDQAAAEAKRIGAGLLGPEESEKRIERKSASVAVHERGLEKEAGDNWIDSVENIWQGLVADGLEAQRFDGGLELRALGKHKGTAIAELLGLWPEAGVMVYVGDDQTDEDAFLALPVKGIGIKVGEDPRAAAEYGVRDCGAVQELLKEWNKHVRAGSE